MVHTDWLLAVVGVDLGTYAVRALPFWFSGFDRLPRPIHRFLELVPAAALGALIIPDVLMQVTPMVAIGAPLIAFALALRGLSVAVVVVVSRLSAWVGLILLG